jgi:hypothetical protein
VNYPLPLATDPSGVAAGSVACSPASGSELPLGRTTVTCSARDTVGNASSAAFRVDVAAAPVVPGAPAEPGAPATPEAPAAPRAPETPSAPSAGAGGQAQRPARAVALGRRLRISRGVARVAISCRADNPVPCRGTLKLEGAGKRRAGSVRFALAPGKKATVRVRLSGAARRALSRRGQLRVKAIATTSDQAGRPLIGARSFKVKAARR